MARWPRQGSWEFPPIDELAPGEDLVATGADLGMATLLDAYRAGYFPMPLPRWRLGWFSPDPRGILPPSELRVTKSLRRSMKRYEVRVDTAFREVMAACADPARPHGWIDQRILTAYGRLHDAGWAHSIEAWDDEGLAGGLYGIAIGGFFAGESMFHRRTDASKVALVHLCELLGSEDHVVLDVQWVTPHLESLGARAIPRTDYASILQLALELPPRPAFGKPESI